MNKLSGLILDAADDHDGAVLRSIFPSQESVPELIKEAQYLDPGHLSVLPDDLFALILHDGDVTLRKFACADAGNTALSVEYFMKTADKLPVAARQAAAQNLVTACGWYGIEPPRGLEKVALGLLLPALTTAVVAPGASRQAKANLQAARASGGRINPNVTKAPVAQVR